MLHDSLMASTRAQVLYTGQKFPIGKNAPYGNRSLSSPLKLAERWGSRAEPSIKQRPKWLLAAMPPKGTVMRKKSLKQRPPVPKPPVQAKAKVSPLRNLTPEPHDRLRLDLMEACLAVTETHGLTVERSISQISTCAIALKSASASAFRVRTARQTHPTWPCSKFLLRILA